MNDERTEAEAMSEAVELAAIVRDHLRPLMEAIGEPGSCKGCGLPIYWVQHRNGKRAPYTATGDNHFIDCPAAARFRKVRTP